MFHQQQHQQHQQQQERQQQQQQQQHQQQQERHQQKMETFERVNNPFSRNEGYSIEKIKEDVLKNAMYPLQNLSPEEFRFYGGGKFLTDQEEIYGFKLETFHPLNPGQSPFNPLYPSFLPKTPFPLF